MWLTLLQCLVKSCHQSFRMYYLQLLLGQSNYVTSYEVIEAYKANSLSLASNKDRESFS